MKDIMDNFNITIDEFVKMYGYTAVDSHVVSDYYFYMETLKTFCIDFEDEGGAMTSNDIDKAKYEAWGRVQRDTSHYVPTNPLQRKLQLIKEVV